jgi:hypothetical protein
MSEAPATTDKHKDDVLALLRGAFTPIYGDDIPKRLRHVLREMEKTDKTIHYTADGWHPGPNPHEEPTTDP